MPAAYSYSGGDITDATRAGLTKYLAFRKLDANIGITRAELSRRWQVEKARIAVQESDPKWVFNELLKLSRNSPRCFPYGLSPAELSELPKLRAALVRARLA